MDANIKHNIKFKVWHQDWRDKKHCILNTNHINHKGWMKYIYRFPNILGPEIQSCPTYSLWCYIHLSIPPPVPHIYVQSNPSHLYSLRCYIHLRWFFTTDLSTLTNKQRKTDKLWRSKCNQDTSYSFQMQHHHHPPYSSWQNEYLLLTHGL